MNAQTSFARRSNRDSSIDSICTRCYQTIASGRNESDLTLSEASHSCDPDGEFNLSHQERHTAPA